MKNQDFEPYSGSPVLEDVTPFMQEVLMDTDCNIDNIDDKPSKEKWDLNLKLHKATQFDPILVDKYFLSRFQCTYPDPNGQINSEDQSICSDPEF